MVSGRALAAATRSATDRKGRFAGQTSTLVALKIMETGARSAIGSKPMLRTRDGFTASVPILAEPIVVPSGTARATAWAPMFPPAPARLSTTTLWPSAACK